MADRRRYGCTGGSTTGIVFERWVIRCRWGLNCRDPTIVPCETTVADLDAIRCATVLFELYPLLAGLEKMRSLSYSDAVLQT